MPFYVKRSPKNSPSFFDKNLICFAFCQICQVLLIHLTAGSLKYQHDRGGGGGSVHDYVLGTCGVVGRYGGLSAGDGIGRGLAMMPSAW